MPIPSTALQTDMWLRVLLLGPPKNWKTTTAICTSPGPARILLCESDTALSEAVRKGADFDFERCAAATDLNQDKPYEQMTTYLAQAKADAKAGKIKTLIIDPLSDFADRLLGQSLRANLTSNGEEDGRTGYPHYQRRLFHCLELAFTIPAHVIFISHFMNIPNGLGVNKTGDGIVPNVPGTARVRIAAKFNDVLWMDLPSSGDLEKRSFYTSPKGAWGPGCRSLSGKYTELPADFTKLIATFKTEIPKPKAASNGVVTAKPMTDGKPPVIKPPMKPQSQAARR